MNIGIVGGGQLAQMLALAGIPLGHRFRFLDPGEQPCAAMLGTHVRAAFDDVQALVRFAQGMDVVTYEFERIPYQSMERVASVVPVYPSPACLAASQERLLEKQLFQQFGIPTPLFAPIDAAADIPDAIRRVGLPCVVKTRRDGYDGKGQCVIRSEQDCSGLWERLGGVPLIAEQFVSFSRELSLLSVRGTHGNVVHYPLTENLHQGGILRRSLAPASTNLQPIAEQYANGILQHFGYVGVLCIEFFEADGKLLANEMAPRVHNSGHWTIEGATCSQFENHIRAITGAPLGSVHVPAPAAMLNMIGVIPDASTLLAEPGLHAHIYGKNHSRPGSKLGHATFCGTDAWQRAESLRTTGRWPQA